MEANEPSAGTAPRARPREAMLEAAHGPEEWAAAFEIEASRIGGGVLAAGATAPTWEDGLLAALDAFASFVENDPPLATAMLVGVHRAGEPALRRREQVIERFCRALDSARRIGGPGHEPPPSTARFMVGAIESAAASALIAGEAETFRGSIAGLSHLVCAAYFGE